MDLPQSDRMAPVDGQALADTMLAPCGSQPLLNPSQTGLFGSQADPFGSQPGGYGASQMDHLLPGSQDGLPGGWHGAGHATPPVKTEPQEEPAWATGLGLGPAADLHSVDWRQQQDQPLKLDPEDEAEYERQLASGSQPTFDPFQPAQQPWEQEGQPWQQQAQPWQQHPFQRQSMAQQALAWVPQPPVPLTQQQPVPYAVLEPQLHQMFAGQPAAAQQKQQPQPADEAPAAGCGSNHLLLSPAAAMGASGEEPAEDAAPAVAACPPATAEAAAAGSRKRKAQQAAGGSPPAKQPARKPARQAAAAAAPAPAGARSKGGSSSQKPARRGQASGSKSPVRCTAGRAIAKKALQPRTPNKQQLQPALLAEAAASKAATKQCKQQAQQGSGMAARRRQGKPTASKARAAKAAPKQQQAAAKAGARKPASTAGSSKAKAQAGSMGGKASRSKSAAGGSKAAAKQGGKAATSGSSSKGGAKAAAGGRKRKAGGSKRMRVSRPCTGNSTGRRKGGMNVPPEKLWAYHMDLLGPGGKAKLAVEFETRTDSLSVKVQSFLRGLLGPKMRLTDESILYQAGSAQSRPPSLSLDKQRLLAEGITTFGAFATRYLEPAED